MEKKRERYGNLDGLRALSCILIVFYHVRKYSEFVLPDGMNAFVDLAKPLVPLFLMISGFGIFCGYYDKVISKTIDFRDFYKKRYKKILPFFAFILLINLVAELSAQNVVEVLTQLTLAFGLLPTVSMEVCGVAWTLGVIFVFYMLFPFLVFCCETKGKAIITLIISIFLSEAGSFYFFTEKFVIQDYPAKHLFLYNSPYFIAGGIIFLYKDSLKKMISSHRIVSLIVCAVISVVWYITPETINECSIIVFKDVLLLMPWLAYFISVKSVIMDNKFVKILSDVSLEMYLAQMVIFRLFEKVFGLYFAGKQWPGYILVGTIVLVLLVLFVEAWQFGIKYVIPFIIDKFVRRKENA